MKMTFSEACDFFANHGNIGSSEELQRTKPSLSQLDAAYNHATLHAKQDHQMADEARRVIAKHYDLSVHS